MYTLYPKHPLNQRGFHCWLFGDRVFLFDQLSGKMFPISKVFAFIIAAAFVSCFLRRNQFSSWQPGYEFLENMLSGGTVKSTNILIVTVYFQSQSN